MDKKNLEAVRHVLQKEAMSVVLRNVVHHNWGWFSREDQRMHLQTVDDKSRVGKNKVRVWLETKGKRTFELSSGSLSGPELKKLKDTVEAERESIEDGWSTFMAKNRWLKVSLADSIVTITAYPGAHNSFIRTLDLRTEFPGAYDNETGWANKEVLADFDEEHCALAVGPERKLDQREHIYLPKILWLT
jgi:hypothetical protein